MVWHGEIYLSPLTAILISPQFSSSLINISPDNWVMDVSISHPKLSNITICNIYAPARSEHQHSFWSSLLLPPLQLNTMVVGGDFNCITRPIDHSSSTSYHRHTHPECFQRLFPSLIDL